MAKAKTKKLNNGTLILYADGKKIWKNATNNKWMATWEDGNLVEDADGVPFVFDSAADAASLFEESEEPEEQRDDREEINRLRAKLKNLRTAWEKDGSSPPRYRIMDGLDRVLAIVDPWSDYQNAHKPLVVGWKVNHSENRYSNGSLLVQDYDSVDATIAAAMSLAEKELGK